MSLRKKFIALSILTGLLMAAISIVGYMAAYNNLRANVESELIATVDSRARMFDGWIHGKSGIISATSNVLTEKNRDLSEIEIREILSAAKSDKEILELGLGNESGFFYGYNAGNKTGQIDPRERDWYKQGKSLAFGNVSFTEPYIDKFTSKLIVSAIAPYNKDNKFYGTLFLDMDIYILDDEIKKMKYHGVGNGIVIQKDGVIIANSGPEKPLTNFKDIPEYGEHFSEMTNNETGFFITDGNGELEKNVFAYTTAPISGWIIGLTIPYDFVFAPVQRMRILYLICAMIGVIIMVCICLKFSYVITSTISVVETNAKKLANGNLPSEAIPIATNDEIGSLATAFNKMAENLRELITKIASVSEQVAASSEELTASAQQSADASVHVAETVGNVSHHIEDQISDVNSARDNVNNVFKDIQEMANTADDIAKASAETASIAEEGSSLMDKAVESMDNIEKSVQESVDVIQRLENSSKQIGQAVETIASIAEQTNLLALNAAIEAARAGEAGKGFSVVADEVRKLAEESQHSATEISKRITTVLDDIGYAVTAMQKETQEVHNGTAAIRDVGKKFQNIIIAVENIQDKMQSMNDCVHQVTSGANYIVKAVDDIQTASNETASNIQTISSSTQEQSASNEEIAAASQALAVLATEMQDTINKFHI